MLSSLATRNAHAVLFAVVLSFYAAWCSAAPQTVKTALLRITLDDGTGELIEFIHDDHDFAAASSEPIWRLELLGTSPTSLTPDRAKQVEARPQEHGLRLTWTGFGLDDLPELAVSVTVSLDAASAQSAWTIDITGLGDAPLGAVHFPRLPALAPQEKETLAVPVWMGEMTSRARELLNANGHPGRWQWEYPGLLSLQCIALYGAGADSDLSKGLALTTDDTQAYGKRFAVFGDGQGGMGVEVVQLPENLADNLGRYTSPYAVRLGAFEGDWYTAAATYRDWALEQPWAKQARLKNGATADWAKDTGLWVWNRRASEHVLPPAAALQEAAGLPVSVFWHWWHGCAYDTNFPEYLPPREGAEAFQAALAEAHEAGLHAIVYMNQRLWGMTAASWHEKNAERYDVKDPAGKVHPEVYNTFNKAPCASMCMGTEFWRDTYADIAVEAVNELGVDGIYMDQACSSLACFDPSHGHPLGGGTYWMKGFQSLQQDIRDRTQTKKRVVLAGEGTGEAWLPYLDLMLSLQVSRERYAAPGEWQPIPFFHAVYHGYFLPYGNYASLTMPPYDELWPAEFAPETQLVLLDRKFSQQFRLEQGRSFVWGQQPTVANFRPEHLDTRTEEMDFVLRIAKLRAESLKFLRDGTFLRPPALAVPEEEIPMSRLSIYAGQQGALREYTASYSTVLAAAWQAPDGDIGIALANISDKPQPVGFTLATPQWPLPETGRIHKRTPGDRTQLTGFTHHSATIKDTLAAQEVCLYELTE
ncbi:MAG: hypothetical protein IT368_03445 [Candidatus Hydrogenedentes bacterium]|nr:hypothetical protein [Candidatus Hydrogenedentota bacterium]